MGTPDRRSSKSSYSGYYYGGENSTDRMLPRLN